MASVGSGLGFSPHPRYWVKLGWKAGGPRMGRRLVSAWPFYNTHLCVLLVPGRVSLLCAWQKLLQVLGVA